MYGLIQPDSPTYGHVISRHRTPEAAHAAYAQALRALHRRPGSQSSYLNWRVMRLAPGTSRATRVNLLTGTAA